MEAFVQESSSVTVVPSPISASKDDESSSTSSAQPLNYDMVQTVGKSSVATTIAEATTSTTEATSTTTKARNDDEDTILFGTLATRIADAMADRVDVALAEGVASLPLLEGAESIPSNSNSNSNNKVDDLLQRLKRCYMKHIDIVEVYAARNIFTISMYPPKRRQRILQEYLQFQHPVSLEPSTTSQREEDESKSTNTVSNTSYQYPTKDQIPSSEDMNHLQEELDMLRKQLQDARRQRNELLVHCQSVELAQSTSQSAISMLKEHSIENIHNQVTAVIMGGQGLDSLKQEGTKLIQKLDEHKRERGGNNDADNQEDIAPWELPTRKKKKIPTLEEHYKDHRRTVDAGLDSLAAVHKFIQRKG